MVELFLNLVRDVGNQLFIPIDAPKLDIAIGGKCAVGAFIV